MSGFRVLILFLLIWSNSLGQFNYVPNPSFESLDTCPYLPASVQSNGINYAIPWFQPCVQNSSDYFNSCATSSDWSVPNNYFGYQLAKSGVAYAGIVLRTASNSNYREYLEVELIDTLQQNHLYCLSFNLNIANGCMVATDAIHAHLSNVMTTQSSLLSMLNLPKTVSNLTNNFLIDSLGWMEIKGIFTANGGEKYLTIGNFDNDTVAQTVNVNYGNLTYAYYYVDDVSLINCDSLTSINEHNEETISVFPNPASEMLTISSSNPIQLKYIGIISLDGKRVKHYQPGNAKLNSFELDVSGIQTGLYFLRLQTEKGLVTKKIMISNN